MSVRAPACLHVYRVHAVSMEFRIGCHSLELELMGHCVGVRRFTCALCKTIRPANALNLGAVSLAHMLFTYFLNLFYMYGCSPTCLSAHYLYAWCHKMALDSFVTGVTGACEPPCWCWKLNLDPLKEEPVLLAAELSFQSM